MPRLSVVVAAHQAEETLADAVASALDQTVPPHEVVVCDDGSTDGTPEVLRALAAADPRVRPVRRDNGGEGAAKNTAVRVATGDWVVVLDADDLLLPRRLEAARDVAVARPDLDVLVCDAVLEVDGVPVRRAYHRDWPFPVQDQRAALLAGNPVLGLASVRRDRWLAVGGFDEHLHHAADWDFFLRLVLAGGRVGLVDVPLARYRLGSGGLSRDRERLLRARAQVLQRALERTDLSAAERRTAAALTGQEAELRVRETLALLPSGGPAARAAAASTALAAGVPTRRRLGL
ncbi:MAG: glycosyl transferase group 1, partial [Frankiales bacterium]|nr:glycosyl transferase group 1 [Frankiales bacterium]